MSDESEKLTHDEKVYRRAQALATLNPGWSTEADGNVVPPPENLQQARQDYENMETFDNWTKEDG